MFRNRIGRILREKGSLKTRLLVFRLPVFQKWQSFGDFREISIQAA
ncbi:hypothetical protein [Alysiella crassa]|nr:hypothetical protein [Alysiella crassa]UOP06600.1 hypothetical protein LVJ80_12730 [Alysiella crassa]